MTDNQYIEVMQRLLRALLTRLEREGIENVNTREARQILEYGEI